jgi:hypothetical protein
LNNITPVHFSWLFIYNTCISQYGCIILFMMLPVCRFAVKKDLMLLV